MSPETKCLNPLLCLKKTLFPITALMAGKPTRSPLACAVATCEVLGVLRPKVLGVFGGMEEWSNGVMEEN